MKRLWLLLIVLVSFLEIKYSIIYRLLSYSIQLDKIDKLVLEQNNICLPLQTRIDQYIKDFNQNISISVLDGDGRFIVQINSDLPRIPASNQKLFTTAYALDKLGPKYTLKTNVRKIFKGPYIISGNGDPDLDISNLRDISYVISNHYKSNNSNKPLKILLIEEPISSWWNSYWTRSDKRNVYGAPISKLALSSNSSTLALKNPINNFATQLRKFLALEGLNPIIDVREQINPWINFSHLLYENKSAPLYVLLNLVNSESHNFTSEVILRKSLSSWSKDINNKKYNKWLIANKIDSSNLFFSDGSGLSRQNKLTTNSLTKVLRRMSINRYSDYYFSSLSIIGLRGTLSKVTYPNSLYGDFIGKSGTLSDVKSLSGILKSKKYYISLISYKLDGSLNYMINIIDIISRSKTC